MADDLRQVPFKITEPDRIASQRYYDEAFYKAECEHLWPHVWQMACRLEEIPEVGDWAEYSNLGKSVIVVRTKDGIKAHHNACRHRGVPLNEGNGHGNCKGKGFICPFHGWRFNMDGENTFVYGKHLFEERQLDQADLALKPCRVETWGGCAFINHDDNAPSLRETMGPVLDRLTAHGQDGQRAEWWYATHIPANWKVAMEAFMEGYHVMRTHPQLQKAVPVLYNSMYGHDTGGISDAVNPDWTKEQNVAAQLYNLQLLSEGMAGMVHAKEVAIARAVIGLLADREHFPSTVASLDGDNGRLAQDHASPRHVDERVGRAEIDGNIVRKYAANTKRHSQSAPGTPTCSQFGVAARDLCPSWRTSRPVSTTILQ